MYFVFGERDNKIIHIDEITPSENGLKCNCICPSCGEKLKANALGTHNKKYFSHKGNSNCINGLETTMHKFAKEVIEEEKKIKIPKLIYNKNFKEFEIVKEQMIDFDKIELEKYLSDFDFKPDIIIFKNDVPLIIEVAVTHKIDEEKKNKIIKSNISTVEIYLDKDEIFQLSKEELTSKIINNTDNKRWIFNRLEESKRKSINDRLSAKKTQRKAIKRTEKRSFEELELERLQLKYKVDINNLPYILKSSKKDLFIFRYYTIKTYWRLIVWDKFINKKYKKEVNVDDVEFWFHNTYNSKQDLSNLKNHLQNYMNISNSITKFLEELAANNILINPVPHKYKIDKKTHSEVIAQYKYQVNPQNLNIFRDILKKIKWTKIGGTWNGMVYKCPRSPMEDHDLGLQDIENCEKCKYFNGYVYEDRRKISIKCRCGIR
ncbi:hypothetical protein [Clostridium beijerinckii]|uniref:Competence protein CoiA-like family protein n=1 Tax=Clostridium beijerinckii TaxID=1520 RepID=A0AAE5EXQ6_CLOBE|nr:hypothetical protein [Clostridium beijerinckii]NSB15174.1 hypothetical protein [Clostridium beijerinckii]OOM21289.1 hypothetical protein CLOBE_47290 [Clostridium beijerinckii]